MPPDVFHHKSILVTGLSLWLGTACLLAHELPAVEVVGRHDNAIGTSDAASQGVVQAEAVSSRAMLRPAEALENIPGMVVTQHSGDGKANQYFLRGVNLDHGTDFATTLNGVPLNLPSHAHGQGYTDLNLLIPELLSRIDYRKGPYFASEGDFSSVGSANLVYRTSLDKPLVQLTLGPHGYLRALAAESRQIADGVTLLTALERQNNNGPWTVPEGMRKLNGQLILSGGSPRSGWTASVSAYESHWTSTDQVPQRLLDAGTYQGAPFGRFDSLDPTDGAHTRRIGLSGTWHRLSDHDMTHLSWYAVDYSLDLLSNFTYALDRVSDQFAQTDQRQLWGGKLSQSWLADVGRVSLIHTVGLQLRQDHIRLGLLDSLAGRIQSAVREDAVVQTQLGLYADSEVSWTPWLKTVTGLRLDQFDAGVSSARQPQNSGKSGAAQASPKLSVVLQPWESTELFLNMGRGFHSNDARGTTSRIDPRSLLPVSPVPGLVSSLGRELGMKSQLTQDWLMRLAWWRLDSDSELVYVGDAGTTVPGRAARRDGVEWSQQLVWRHGLSMDTSLAWTRPRYMDADPAGAYIPNAVSKVATVSLSLRQMGDWSGSWGLRYLGSAPLVEDNSLRSASSLSSQLRVSRQLSNDVMLSFDWLNLTNRQNQDISYAYVSRVTGEPAMGVNGLHVHPAEPRTLRVTLRTSL